MMILINKPVRAVRKYHYQFFHTHKCIDQNIKSVFVKQLCIVTDEGWLGGHLYSVCCSYKHARIFRRSVCRFFGLETRRALAMFIF